jgi:hypothetical protein
MKKLFYILGLLCFVSIGIQVNANNKNVSSFEVHKEIQVASAAQAYLALYYETSISDVTVSFYYQNQFYTAYKFTVISKGINGLIKEFPGGEFIVEDDIDGL